jgi:hypothetical protein
MNPRPRQFLVDATIAATVILAIGVARAAYTRATAGTAPQCGAAIHAAAPPHPHIACAFAIAEQCRKLEWWPE